MDHSSTFAHMGNEVIVALYKPKKELISPPALALLRLDSAMILDADASCEQVLSALSPRWLGESAESIEY